MTMSSPRRAYLVNRNPGYTLSAQYHTTKGWDKANKGQEERKPKGCPVLNRTSFGGPFREAGARITFVPRPDKTQENAVVSPNKDWTTTPWNDSSNLSVAALKSKDRRLRVFRSARRGALWSNVPKKGIRCKTSIHQSWAGRSKACLKAFGIAKIRTFPAPSYHPGPVGYFSKASSSPRHWPFKTL